MISLKEQAKIISKKQNALEEVYDFSCIKEVLADKRVVMLGEADHGDAASFAIRAALVKYLHLQCGFNIFAIEADFFSLYRGWMQAKSSKDVEDLAQNVYSFWRKDKSMQSLWGFFSERFAVKNHIERPDGEKPDTERPDTERPIVVAGFDVRHNSRFANEIVSEIENIIKLNNIEAPNDFEKFQATLLELLTKEYKHKVSAYDRQQFFFCLSELQTRFAENEQADPEIQFWLQELKNLEYTARNAWGFEYRDVGMAKNVLWLLEERYPDEKIIVWAHNFHIAKDSVEVASASESYRDHVKLFPDTIMGDVLHQKIGNDLYALGLISGGGKYNRLAYQANHEDVTEIVVSEESLANQLNQEEGEVLFVDLLSETDKFLMGGLHHNNELCLQWSKVFDGLIYYSTSYGIEV